LAFIPSSRRLFDDLCVFYQDPYRRPSSVLVSAFLVIVFAVAAGVRYNGTPSFPAGFYLAQHREAQRGNLVFVTVPDSPVFAMAKERRYLNVAFSPAPRLLKRLVGVAGDRVSIDSTGVSVNGIRLANSTPLKVDGAGRPLKVYALKDHFLAPGEVLLMSEYNPDSFDSRYFGQVPGSLIESVATPLLTFQ
jgi:conjugative transfer signal peptidase TraF